MDDSYDITSYFWLLMLYIVLIRLVSLESWRRGCFLCQ